MCIFRWPHRGAPACRGLLVCPADLAIACFSCAVLSICRFSHAEWGSTCGSCWRESELAGWPVRPPVPRWLRWPVLDAGAGAMAGGVLLLQAPTGSPPLASILKGTPAEARGSPPRLLEGPAPHQVRPRRTGPRPYPIAGPRHT